MRSLEIQTHWKEKKNKLLLLHTEGQGMQSYLLCNSDSWFSALCSSCYSIVNLQLALLTSESVNGWKQLFEIHGSPQYHRRT